jgi:hypothetical protein
VIVSSIAKSGAAMRTDGIVREFDWKGASDGNTDRSRRDQFTPSK